MSHVRLPRLVMNRNSNTFNYDLKNISELVGNKSDEAIILEAIQIGYLQYPSKEFIWNIYKQQSDFDPIASQKLIVKSSRSRYLRDETLVNDYTTIKYLNLFNIPIIELGDIYLCSNIRILNLSNNYLINIDSLASCTQLFRLDLQNNQITDIPDQDFWSNMKKLRILYLHNNPIGKLEHLKNLAVCPTLEILTLYDTPVSLKNSYRHHTVNSIISLKALDDFVVSDEEIIEEANFNNMFSAKSPVFKLKLTVPQSQENSFKSELKATFKLIKQVNRVLSHYSPVLIIQKNIRRFIIQRRFRSAKSQIQNEAASRIQKWWQKIKEETLSRKSSEQDNEAPKKKPIKVDLRTRTLTSIDVKPVTESSSFVNDKKQDQKRMNSPASVNKRNIIIDLNKLGRRQASYLDTASLKAFSIDEYPNAPPSSDIFSLSSAKPNTFTKRDEQLIEMLKQRNIDGNKIVAFSKMLQMLNYDDQDKESLIRSLNSEFLKLLKDDSSKSTKISSNSEKDINNKAEKEEEYDDTIYRLPILKSNNNILKQKDAYIVDMVKEKYIGSNLVKQMQNESHKIIYDNKAVEPVSKEKHQFITNDQRFFQKIYGNMNLGCLRAVDKAYEERNMGDLKLLKEKNVENLKEFKKYSQQQVEFFREDKIKDAQNSMMKDNAVMKLAHARAVKDFDKLKERVREMRRRNIETQKSRRKDVMLAIDFSKQHLSVSKALQKHEFLNHKEINSTKNNTFVAQQRVKKDKQRDIVEKYLEQRNMLRLIQSTEDRKIIENRIKEEREYEDYLAKRRVEFLRGRKAIEKDHSRLPNPTKVLNMADDFNPTTLVDESY